MYGVPESTLRDRTRHIVSVDCKVGPETLFTDIEESALAHHIKHMANVGYGYTMTNIRFLAADYARSLGKDVKSKDSLSTVWFYAFLKRHPDLKIVQPQKLEISRAKGASHEKIENYFRELREILTENDLLDKPERIYNIDETGISTQHTPPKIVCDKESKPQTVTSPKSSNVTIIGGANALGNFVPPYYIFPGKRWNPKFIEDAPHGSGGEMSDSGWVNSAVFENYVTGHISKHFTSNAADNHPTLILYDGHKSHLSLTLTEWAKKSNVLLFVLPPHTSHLTQPLDVGVFGPFKKFYYSECQQYLQKNPGAYITKYEIAKLTGNPYLKAFSPSNITAAFKKSGIFPLDEACISIKDTAPSSIYPAEPSTCEADENVPCQQKVSHEDPKSQKSEHNVTSFFESRTITSVQVKQRPKKKFVPPYLCGNLLNSKNTAIIENKAKSNASKSAAKCINKQEVCNKQIKSNISKSPLNLEKPSTSGISKSGGPICLTTPSISDSSDSDIGDSDEDKCCVCNLWSPAELKGCTSIVFVKWGKCDFCPHWVHLKFCTEVKVIRRATVFRCPHCAKEE
jgi:hypothetical protein